MTLVALIKKNPLSFRGFENKYRVKPKELYNNIWEVYIYIRRVI